MPVQRTLQAHWPLDCRNLMPEPHQRAAWLALCDSRDLLADIAQTMKLLSHAAFSGQEAARRMALALNSALVELEVDLGLKGVLEFQAPQASAKAEPGGCKGA